ncbi:hypothetical protein [Nostoc sp.]|uniref:hypothetical protein n=1 Tax=Nostoc sp. TaxID=1180 RepID=UPI002FF91452
MNSKQQMLSSGKFCQTTPNPAGDTASLPDARSLLAASLLLRDALAHERRLLQPHSFAFTQDSKTVLKQIVENS